MGIFTEVEKQLKVRGYAVQTFSSGAEAVDYLNRVVDGVTVGIGGSATVKTLNAYTALKAHNTVYWHWEQDADEARQNAMTTDVYLASANALAETGEIVNIDGKGNRVASMLFGHKKVYFIIGRNKLVPTYEEAVWRAKNIAAPIRAQQMNMKTPCAIKADKCYECNSPDKVCHGMVTLWGPMMGSAAEVLLIDEDLGI
ncbi:lactate utilization protein [Fusibacter paucivorans]|uniref:Lactate utilization protein n=1 Tax=Fusibacter paucivorans TaxID=76009 RepID=A0ABS5PLL9_9FIRM|nr:lactate utilization protein [Fusibacter paucivorans]MBS7525246.1 lactate utilization protein [Fusibacter paucivorans]